MKREQNPKNPCHPRSKQQQQNKQTKGKSMNNKFDELTKSLAKSVTRRAALKKFGLDFAGLALTCFAVASVSMAQTSVVCDPAGDATYAGAKGGPKIPAWLDIVQSEV